MSSREIFSPHSKRLDRLWGRYRDRRSMGIGGSYRGRRSSHGVKLTTRLCHLHGPDLVQGKKEEIYYTVCGPGSSVDIVPDYGMDGPGSNPGEDEIFLPSRPALGPT